MKFSPLTYEDIQKIYNKIVKRAIENKDKPNKALQYIIAASSWMYTFNLIYGDERIEMLIKEIAKTNLPNIKINKTTENKVCFIDSFGYDNRGLTQQYLRGFMTNSMEILYILHNDFPKYDSEIIKELSAYSNAEIVVIKDNRKDILSLCKRILKQIKDFSPEYLFIHASPWDVTSFLCADVIDGINKYNINLTDHAFWIGSSVIDYNIEFRKYGEIVSLQKRGLSKEKEISLPYYPIISKYTNFLGFPELPKDSIKVLCGGSQYKMLGKDGVFFNLMDILLRISPKIHIIVVGISQESIFGQYSNKLDHNDRIHFIGNRKDIAEVFRNSDIYLSSYPFLGGLMSQYAAFYAKPILVYKNGGDAGTPADVVNHFGKGVRLNHSLEEFENYAKKLIEDENLCLSEGELLKSSMITEDIFNQSLKKILQGEKVEFCMGDSFPDYEFIKSYYLDIENSYLNKSIINLIKILRFKAIGILSISQILRIINLLFRRHVSGQFADHRIKRVNSRRT